VTNTLSLTEAPLNLSVTTSLNKYVPLVRLVALTLLLSPKGGTNLAGRGPCSWFHCHDVSGSSFTASLPKTTQFVGRAIVRLPPVFAGRKICVNFTVKLIDEKDFYPLEVNVLAL
jgi:hypothetical protein